MKHIGIQSHEQLWLTIFVEQHHTSKGILSMERGLDNWELTLITLFACAVKGKGFYEVTADRLPLKGPGLNWTLYILQMRCMIEGCRFEPPSPGDKDSIIPVERRGLMLTPKGFETAEALLGQDSDSERLHKAHKLLSLAKCYEMADLVYNWLTEW